MRRPVWLTRSVLLLSACLALAPRPAFAQHNSTRIVVPASGLASDVGPARLYPSTIEVASGVGAVYSVSVILHNVTPAVAVASNVGGCIDQVNAYVRLHHQDPDDVDLLLVGPGGQKTLLMSDAGGYGDLPGQGVSLWFDDTALLAMPDTATIASTTYAPTDHGPTETFEAPAPAGPYPASLGVFRAAPANGAWSLYARDDAAQGTGSISQWGLEIVTVSPPAPPMISLEKPSTFETSSAFVYVSADVDDPTDALVTWRNAANGATGVAVRNFSSIFGASVPVVAGNNPITFTLTNAAGEQPTAVTRAVVDRDTWRLPSHR